MAESNLALSEATAAPSSRAIERRRDRIFFGVMSGAMALTVFAGFAPTYYLKGVFGTPALHTVFHVHGALFTTWIVLFVVQVALISAKRTNLHKQLGYFGALLAATMVVVGLLAAVASVRRGFTPPGGPPPLVFFVIPFTDMVVFTGLAGAALLLRRRTEAHKRLILMSTIGLLTAAIARLPGIAALGPPAFMGLTDLFIVACLVYDRLAHGRVHPAFWAGGLVIIVSQPLRMVAGGTAVWMSFARWIGG